MSKFKLVSDYEPIGDQPSAIAQLTEGLEKGEKHQTLLGVTGSGKTFTMANLIQKTQKPTLILSHNKTLATQLRTLHEFTVAMETHTPLGLLQGAGGIGDQIENLLKMLPNADPDLVIFEADPDKLVAKLTHMLDKLHEPYRKLYK